MSEQAKPKATKRTRAFLLATERYELGQRASGRYARRGDVVYPLSTRGREALRADLCVAWREAEDDDPPGDSILNGVIAELRRLAEDQELDLPTTDETAAATLNERGIKPTLDYDHPERPQVYSANRNPYDVAREVADLLLKANDPPHLFRMGQAGTAVVQVLEDRTLLSLDQNLGGGWLAYVAERISFVGGGETPRIVAPPAPVMKMMPTIILADLPVLDGLVESPYLDSSGEVITEDGYHPGSRLYLLTHGLELPPISAKPTRDEVRAARDLLLDEWLHDFPFVGDADRANAVAELLTITARPFVGLAPLFVNDASTPGSGKGFLTSTVYLIATGKVPEFMELPMDADEQRKTITASVINGDSLLAWDESPVIAGRSLSMILTAEVYSARVLGTAKKIAVRNRFTQIAIGNNVDVRGDLKRRVLPCRLAPDVDDPEHRTGFRHPNLVQWVRENRAELLHAALTIWRYWDASGRKEANLTIGSFEHWGRTVGGALEQAGIPGFATNIGQWLSFSEEDDGWAGHLVQLRKRFGDNWFTVGEVADAVQAGYLKRPPVKRSDDKDLSLQTAYAYRGARERWYAGLRLIRSEGRDGATGSYTWSVRQRGQEREREVDRSPGNASSVSSASSVREAETAGQGTGKRSSGDETQVPARQASSGAGRNPSMRIVAGQTAPTERTEDAEHVTRPVETDSLSPSACLECGELEDSVFHAMYCLGQDPAA